jgi:methionyl-tRNA formyltransferase
MAIELVTKLANKSITLAGSPQDESKASYSLWRDDHDYRINWNDSAKDISHFINCVGSPYLGASTMLNGEIVRISKATPLAELKIENRAPGKVIFHKSGLPIVVCGEGLLLIEDIKNNEYKSMLPLESFRTRFI